MMKSTFLSIVALSLNLMQSTSAQTLYGLSEHVPSQTVILQVSISVSAGGTNSNDIVPDAIFTQVSVPTTFTETFVQDASGVFESVQFIPVSPASPTLVPETCRFGADGRGTCVETVPVESGGNMVSVAVTHSGSVVPFYTLQAASSVPTPISLPASSSPSGSATSPASTSDSATSTSSSTPSASPSTGAAQQNRMGGVGVVGVFLAAGLGLF
ncbi:hypothetical protein B0H19DRAFT_1272154 [Mycena capillaripes]|nr:hypothetical protein B0H19DRAFT_1272154 [Mycena capillaripes]